MLAEHINVIIWSLKANTRPLGLKFDDSPKKIMMDIDPDKKILFV